MFKNLEVFRIANAMATHAGTRQALLSQNIANADTPGYKARDIAPFSQMVNGGGDAGQLQATRTTHLNAGMSAMVPRPGEGAGEASPNGNNVSLEEEMMKAVDVKRQHDKALAIYKSSLGILRASFGRR